MPNQITFRNNVQAVLFENEIKGQICDGNFPISSPYPILSDPWEIWNDTEITVGENVGRNFFPRKANYRLTSNSLLERIGQRMLSYARLAHSGIPRNEIKAYAKLLIDRLDGSIVEEITPDCKAIIEDETSYTMEDMKKDLKDMIEILKTHNG